MDCKKVRSPIFSKTVLCSVGSVILIFLSLVLLWYSNTNSMQAQPALVAQVYFDGDYRIAGGPWQKIVPGKHITSTGGDVTLRGNFHLLAPDGEYVGIYNGDMPIAFYVDHINLTFYERGNEPYSLDIENPLYGYSVCGEDWLAYTIMGESEEPIEILIHNPHVFGNENAIDEMLSGITFWTGIDFEKTVLDRGELQKNTGALFVMIAFFVLGTALFSTLIHIKSTKIVWILGAVILFAGIYLSYSAYGVSFRSESIVSNTTITVSSMIFYMLFLLAAIVYLLKSTWIVGMVTVTGLGVVNAILFVLPMLTDLFFYDILPCWAIVQGIANAVLTVCLVKELFAARGKERWTYIGLILPLVSFGVDVFMIGIGFWKGGYASTCVFIVFSAVAMVMLLKVIPQSINALNEARELETEKIVLNAKLTESRVSTMMSQIRPHFIYNTLGSIEQLCIIDPAKAGELVHNFAKYLRGNFGELDNPKPILMSREMEHVHYYVNIERVRFPDMTFSFKMNSGDFHIPALTVQPIVENAIKHGLMKLPKGGSIRIESYETDTEYCVLVEDDGVGFDTGVLLDERKHVGIRNIRGRLKAMVNGELNIESVIGVGTRVTIRIPKEL